MHFIDFSIQNFQKISSFLQSGGVAILPSDTIPGFTADPEKEQSIKKISKLKKRPPSNPFLLLVSDFSTAEKLCIFSRTAQELAHKFWPGPTTLLLPRKEGALPHFFPEAEELALRIPGDKNVLHFLSAFGRPLVSTSVNISGKQPLLTKNEIQNTFQAEDILLSLPIKFSTTSRESAIIQVKNHKKIVIRNGSMSKHEIENMQ